MKRAVKIIAIIYSVIGGFAFIGCVIMLFTGKVAESIISMITLAISLILLWSLYIALDRIENLEVEVAVLKKTLDSPKKEQIVAKDDKVYRNCQYCGAIVYTTEKKCPKCGHPYDE